MQASLSRSKDATELFAQSGPLEWLVSSPRRYAWTGHFEALSIQVPETFGTELVDILPDGADRWWREGVFKKALRKVCGGEPSLRKMGGVLLRIAP